MNRRDILSFFWGAFVTPKTVDRKPELILYPDGKTGFVYIMEKDMTIIVHPENGKDRTYRVQNGRFYDWREPTTV